MGQKNRRGLPGTALGPQEVRVKKQYTPPHASRPTYSRWVWFARCEARVWGSSGLSALAPQGLARLRGLGGPGPALPMPIGAALRERLRVVRGAAFQSQVRRSGGGRRVSARGRAGAGGNRGGSDCGQGELCDRSVRAQESAGRGKQKQEAAPAAGWEADPGTPRVREEPRRRARPETAGPEAAPARGGSLPAGPAPARRPPAWLPHQAS